MHQNTWCRPLVPIQFGPRQLEYHNREPYLLTGNCNSEILLLNWENRRILHHGPLPLNAEPETGDLISERRTLDPPRVFGLAWLHQHSCHFVIGDDLGVISYHDASEAITSTPGFPVRALFEQGRSIYSHMSYLACAEDPDFWAAIDDQFDPADSWNGVMNDGTNGRAHTTADAFGEYVHELARELERNPSIRASPYFGVGSSSSWPNHGVFFKGALRSTPLVSMPITLTTITTNMDDTLVAASGYSSSIFVYDLATGGMVREFSNAHFKHINITRFMNTSPHMMISCSTDGTMRVWDLRAFEDLPVYTLYHSENLLHSQSPDDQRILVSAGTHHVRQIDIRTGRADLEIELPMTRHFSQSSRAYYANGGDTIVCGSTASDLLVYACSRTGDLINAVRMYEGARINKEGGWVQSLRGCPLASDRVGVLTALNDVESSMEIIEVDFSRRNAGILETLGWIEGSEYLAGDDRTPKGRRDPSTSHGSIFLKGLAVEDCPSELTSKAAAYTAMQWTDFVQTVPTNSLLTAVTPDHPGSGPLNSKWREATVKAMQETERTKSRRRKYLETAAATRELEASLLECLDKMRLEVRATYPVQQKPSLRNISELDDNSTSAEAASLDSETDEESKPHMLEDLALENAKEFDVVLYPSEQGAVPIRAHLFLLRSRWPWFHHVTQGALEHVLQDSGEAIADADDNILHAGKWTRRRDGTWTRTVPAFDPFKALAASLSKKDENGAVPKDIVQAHDIVSAKLATLSNTNKPTLVVTVHFSSLPAFVLSRIVAYMYTSYIPIDDTVLSAPSSTLMAALAQVPLTPEDDTHFPSTRGMVPGLPTVTTSSQHESEYSSSTSGFNSLSMSSDSSLALQEIDETKLGSIAPGSAQDDAGEMSVPSTSSGPADLSAVSRSPSPSDNSHTQADDGRVYRVLAPDGRICAIVPGKSQAEGRQLADCETKDATHAWSQESESALSTEHSKITVSSIIPSNFDISSLPVSADRRLVSETSRIIASSSTYTRGVSDEATTSKATTAPGSPSQQQAISPSSSALDAVAASVTSIAASTTSAKALASVSGSLQELIETIWTSPTSPQAAAALATASCTPLRPWQRLLAALSRYLSVFGAEQLRTGALAVPVGDSLPPSYDTLLDRPAYPPLPKSLPDDTGLAPTLTEDEILEQRRRLIQSIALVATLSDYLPFVDPASLVDKSTLTLSSCNRSVPISLRMFTELYPPVPGWYKHLEPIPLHLYHHRPPARITYFRTGPDVARPELRRRTIGLVEEASQIQPDDLQRFTAYTIAEGEARLREAGKHSSQPLEGLCGEVDTDAHLNLYAERFAERKQRRKERRRQRRAVGDESEYDTSDDCEAFMDSYDEYEDEEDEVYRTMDLDDDDDDDDSDVGEENQVALGSGVSTGSHAAPTVHSPSLPERSTSERSDDVTLTDDEEDEWEEHDMEDEDEADAEEQSSSVGDQNGENERRPRRRQGRGFAVVEIDTSTTSESEHEAEPLGFDPAARGVDLDEYDEFGIRKPFSIGKAVIDLELEGPKVEDSMSDSELDSSEAELGDDGDIGSVGESETKSAASDKRRELKRQQLEAEAKAASRELRRQHRLNLAKDILMDRAEKALSKAEGVAIELLRFAGDLSRKAIDRQRRISRLPLAMKVIAEPLTRALSALRTDSYQTSSTSTADLLTLELRLLDAVRVVEAELTGLSRLDTLEQIVEEMALSDAAASSSSSTDQSSASTPWTRYYVRAINGAYQAQDEKLSIEEESKAIEAFLKDIDQIIACEEALQAHHDALRNASYETSALLQRTLFMERFKGDTSTVNMSFAERSRKSNTYAYSNRNVPVFNDADANPDLMRASHEVAHWAPPLSFLSALDIASDLWSALVYQCTNFESVDPLNRWLPSNLRQSNDLTGLDAPQPSKALTAEHEQTISGATGLKRVARIAALRASLLAAVGPVLYAASQGSILSHHTALRHLGTNNQIEKCVQEHSNSHAATVAHTLAEAGRHQEFALLRRISSLAGLSDAQASATSIPTTDQQTLSRASSAETYGSVPLKIWWALKELHAALVTEVQTHYNEFRLQLWQMHRLAMEEFELVIAESTRHIKSRVSRFCNIDKSIGLRGEAYDQHERLVYRGRSIVQVERRLIALRAHLLIVETWLRWADEEYSASLGDDPSAHSHLALLDRPVYVLGEHDLRTSMLRSVFDDPNLVVKGEVSVVVPHGQPGLSANQRSGDANSSGSEEQSDFARVHTAAYRVATLRQALCYPPSMELLDVFYAFTTARQMPNPRFPLPTERYVPDKPSHGGNYESSPVVTRARKLMSYSLAARAVAYDLFSDGKANAKVGNVHARNGLTPSFAEKVLESIAAQEVYLPSRALSTQEREAEAAFIRAIVSGSATANAPTVNSFRSTLTVAQLPDIASEILRRARCAAYNSVSTPSKAPQPKDAASYELRPAPSSGTTISEVLADIEIDFRRFTVPGALSLSPLAVSAVAWDPDQVYRLIAISLFTSTAGAATNDVDKVHLEPGRPAYKIRPDRNGRPGANQFERERAVAELSGLIDMIELDIDLHRSASQSNAPEGETKANDASKAVSKHWRLSQEAANRIVGSGILLPHLYRTRLLSDLRSPTSALSRALRRPILESGADSNGPVKKLLPGFLQMHTEARELAHKLQRILTIELGRILSEANFMHTDKRILKRVLRSGQSQRVTGFESGSTTAAAAVSPPVPQIVSGDHSTSIEPHKSERSSFESDAYEKFSLVRAGATRAVDPRSGGAQRFQNPPLSHTWYEPNVSIPRSSREHAISQVRSAFAPALASVHMLSGLSPEHAASIVMKATNGSQREILPKLSPQSPDPLAAELPQTTFPTPFSLTSLLAHPEVAFGQYISVSRAGLPLEPAGFIPPKISPHPTPFSNLVTAALMGLTRTKGVGGAPLDTSTSSGHSGSLPRIDETDAAYTRRLREGPVVLSPTTRFSEAAQLTTRSRQQAAHPVRIAETTNPSPQQDGSGVNARKPGLRNDMIIAGATESELYPQIGDAQRVRSALPPISMDQALFILAYLSIPREDTPRVQGYSAAGLADAILTHLRMSLTLHNVLFLYIASRVLEVMTSTSETAVCGANSPFVQLRQRVFVPVDEKNWDLVSAEFARLSNVGDVRSSLDQNNVQPIMAHHIASLRVSCLVYIAKHYAFFNAPMPQFPEGALLDAVLTRADHIIVRALAAGVLGSGPYYDFTALKFTPLALARAGFTFDFTRSDKQDVGRLVESAPSKFTISEFNSHVQIPARFDERDSAAAGGKHTALQNAHSLDPLLSNSSELYWTPASFAQSALLGRTGMSMIPIPDTLCDGLVRWGDDVARAAAAIRRFRQRAFVMGTDAGQFCGKLRVMRSTARTLMQATFGVTPDGTSSPSPTPESMDELESMCRKVIEDLVVLKGKVNNEQEQGRTGVVEQLNSFIYSLSDAMAHIRTYKGAISNDDEPCSCNECIERADSNEFIDILNEIQRAVRVMSRSMDFLVRARDELLNSGPSGAGLAPTRAILAIGGNSYTSPVTTHHILMLDTKTLTWSYIPTYGAKTQMVSGQGVFVWLRSSVLARASIRLAANEVESEENKEKRALQVALLFYLKEWVASRKAQGKLVTPIHELTLEALASFASDPQNFVPASDPTDDSPKALAERAFRAALAAIHKPTRSHWDGYDPELGGPAADGDLDPESSSLERLRKLAAFLRSEGLSLDRFISRSHQARERLAVLFAQEALSRAVRGDIAIRRRLFAYLEKRYSTVIREFSELETSQDPGELALKRRLIDEDDLHDGSRRFTTLDEALQFHTRAAQRRYEKRVKLSTTETESVEGEPRRTEDEERSGVSERIQAANSRDDEDHAQVTDGLNDEISDEEWLKRYRRYDFFPHETEQIRKLLQASTPTTNILDFVLSRSSVAFELDRGALQALSLMERDIDAWSRHAPDHFSTESGADVVDRMRYDEIYNVLRRRRAAAVHAVNAETDMVSGGLTPASSAVLRPSSGVASHPTGVRDPLLPVVLWICPKLPLDQLLALDLSTMTWHSLMVGDRPETRGTNQSLVYDAPRNVVYAAFGEANNRYVNSILALDLETMNWSVLKEDLEYFSSHSVMLVDAASPAQPLGQPSFPVSDALVFAELDRKTRQQSAVHSQLLVTRAKQEYLPAWPYSSSYAEILRRVRMFSTDADYVDAISGACVALGDAIATPTQMRVAHALRGDPSQLFEGDRALVRLSWSFDESESAMNRCRGPLGIRPTMTAESRSYTVGTQLNKLRAWLGRACKQLLRLKGFAPDSAVVEEKDFDEMIRILIELKSAFNIVRETLLTADDPELKLQDRPRSVVRDIRDVFAAASSVRSPPMRYLLLLGHVSNSPTPFSVVRVRLNPFGNHTSSDGQLISTETRYFAVGLGHGFLRNHGETHRQYWLWRMEAGLASNLMSLLDSIGTLDELTPLAYAFLQRIVTPEVLSMARESVYRYVESSMLLFPDLADPSSIEEFVVKDTLLELHYNNAKSAAYITDIRILNALLYLEASRLARARLQQLRFDQPIDPQLQNAVLIAAVRTIYLRLFEAVRPPKPDDESDESGSETLAKYVKAAKPIILPTFGVSVKLVAVSYAGEGGSSFISPDYPLPEDVRLRHSDNPKVTEKWCQFWVNNIASVDRFTFMVQPIAFDPDLDDLGASTDSEVLGYAQYPQLAENELNSWEVLAAEPHWTEAYAYMTAQFQRFQELFPNPSTFFKLQTHFVRYRLALMEGELCIHIGANYKKYLCEAPIDLTGPVTRRNVERVRASHLYQGYNSPLYRALIAMYFGPGASGGVLMDFAVYNEEDPMFADDSLQNARKYYNMRRRILNAVSSPRTVGPAIPLTHQKEVIARRRAVAERVRARLASGTTPRASDRVQPYQPVELVVSWETFCLPPIDNLATCLKRFNDSPSFYLTENRAKYAALTWRTNGNKPITCFPNRRLHSEHSVPAHLAVENNLSTGVNAAARVSITGRLWDQIQDVKATNLFGVETNALLRDWIMRSQYNFAERLNVYPIGCSEHGNGQKPQHQLRPIPRRRLKDSPKAPKPGVASAAEASDSLAYSGLTARAPNASNLPLKRVRDLRGPSPANRDAILKADSQIMRLEETIAELHAAHQEDVVLSSRNDVYHPTFTFRSNIGCADILNIFTHRDMKMLAEQTRSVLMEDYQSPSFHLNFRSAKILLEEMEIVVLGKPSPRARYLLAYEPITSCILKLPLVGTSSGLDFIDLASQVFSLPYTPDVLGSRFRLSDALSAVSRTRVKFGPSPLQADWFTHLDVHEVEYRDRLDEKLPDSIRGTEFGHIIEMVHRKYKRPHCLGSDNALFGAFEWLTADVNVRLEDHELEAKVRVVNDRIAACTSKLRHVECSPCLLFISQPSPTRVAFTIPMFGPLRQVPLINLIYLPTSGLLVPVPETISPQLRLPIFPRVPTPSLSESMLADFADAIQGQSSLSKTLPQNVLIGCEGKYVSVPRLLLTQRSQYFKTRIDTPVMNLGSSSTATDQVRIDIPFIRFPVLQAVLGYLVSGVLDLTNMMTLVEDAPWLLSKHRSPHSEDEAKMLAKQWRSEQISCVLSKAMSAAGTAEFRGSILFEWLAAYVAAAAPPVLVPVLSSLASPRVPCRADASQEFLKECSSQSVLNRIKRMNYLQSRGYGSATRLAKLKAAKLAAQLHAKHLKCMQSSGTEQESTVRQLDEQTEPAPLPTNKVLPGWLSERFCPILAHLYTAGKAPSVSTILNRLFAWIADDQSKVTEEKDRLPTPDELLLDFVQAAVSDLAADQAQQRNLDQAVDPIELLLAADMLCIDSLSLKVQTILSHSLRTSNVVRLLSLAELVSAPKLARACITFIVTRYEMFEHDPQYISCVSSDMRALIRREHHGTALSSLGATIDYVFKRAVTANTTVGQASL